MHTCSKSLGVYVVCLPLCCAEQYSSAGEVTCEQYPASLDHEATDARSFADWGVDYLK
jgi:hypothetical protein